ncbi:MAG: DUF1629 domain-containing protein [Pseudomonadota bacterium]
MALYSIFKDLNNYAYIGFDREEIRNKFGRSPNNHIDVNCKAKSYKDIWATLAIHFSNCDGTYKDTIPDIYEFQGHLFLSMAAYKVLKPIIENDGEFLPITYEKGDGFIFNPLRIAEEVDGLNTDISRKDPLDNIDIVCMAFHEDRVKQFSIFKSDFDLNLSMMCQEAVKEAIEKANLGGVFFTPDLGNPFTTRMSLVSKTH